MRIRIDPFLLAMMAVISLAALLPAQGPIAARVDEIAKFAIAGLFFGHGAALSPRSVVQGLGHWRLHLFIFATTFLGFPALLVPLSLVRTTLLLPDLVLGFIYLAVLPSAVSSSISFTGMAKGNVPAAICSSAASNVFGLMLTTVLFMLFTRSSAHIAIDPVASLRAITMELLLPFALGQASRPITAAWIERHKPWLNWYDQGVILLVIYGAFSHSIVQGLWHRLESTSLILASAVCCVVLAAVIAGTMVSSRRLGFSRGDEIAAIFCGSKKSLASGLPLAQIMFAGNPGLGMIVLPIMLYNQLQILAGAVLAGRYAAGSAGPNRQDQDSRPDDSRSPRDSLDEPRHLASSCGDGR